MFPKSLETAASVQPELKCHSFTDKNTKYNQ